MEFSEQNVFWELPWTRPLVDEREGSRIGQEEKLSYNAHWQPHPTSLGLWRWNGLLESFCVKARWPSLYPLLPYDQPWAWHGRDSSLKLRQTLEELTVDWDKSSHERWAGQFISVLSHHVGGHKMIRYAGASGELGEQGAGCGQSHSNSICKALC